MFITDGTIQDFLCLDISTNIMGYYNDETMFQETLEHIRVQPTKLEHGFNENNTT